ncbi:hypothetical protein B0H19DRAFT_1229272 [Mycena capillaripes]|nr:hypothetical protein B0H19DRAFT_1229272 [Mycena capillaripes]
MSDLESELAAAKTNCGPNAGNTILYCYPMVNTVAVQDASTALVWNAAFVDLVGVSILDIYLFHADSQQQILHFSNVINPVSQAGEITAPVNDSWWGDRGSSWAGANISFPYFWILTPSNVSMSDGVAKPQATFQAVQTTLPDSLRGTATAPGVTPSKIGSSSTLTSSPSAQAPTGSGQPSGSMRKVSSLRPALIVGVIVGVFVGIALVISALFFVRRRFKSRQANNQLVDPLPYEEHAPHGPKAALNAEMRAVQARLHNLRTPSAGSPTEEGGGNSELHRQIAVLTAEVERLRAMGAEEPPPYSL